MATFNDLISRTGATALIPTQYTKDIMQDAAEESVVLRMATRLPNMTSATLSMPVLNTLPYAYFVNGDTGLKQTTKVDWTNKMITAEEIAVIVPVPDSVLADSQFDIWGQIRPLVRQAFGQVIDAAVLYGVNKPGSWPDGILTGAESNGNAAEITDDGYADVMGPDGLIAKLESQGYLVNGYVGALQARGYLRGIRDGGGQPLFRNGMAGGTSYVLDGQPIEFPRNGGVDPEKTLLIAGDWSKLVYAIRQDLTVTRTNDGVISDADGKIIYNLYQQDMSALRFVMRLGWQLPNPPSAMGSEGRYPFAVLKPKAE